MFNIEQCPSCLLPMIGQYVWIGDDMIPYYVCPNCGGIKAESHHDDILDHEKRYVCNINAYFVNGVTNEEKN